MITIKVGRLNNDLFWGAINTIDNDTSLPVVAALHFNKLKNALNEEAKQLGEVYTKLLKEFAQVDDKGNILTELVTDQGLKKPLPILKEDADKVLYAAKLNEFYDTEVRVDMDKLEVSDLGNCKLSPKMLGLLEPVLES